MKHSVDNYGCPLFHICYFLSDRRLEGFPVPKELKRNEVEPFSESYRGRSIMNQNTAQLKREIM